MIHLCYAVSDKKGTYTKLVGTSLRSVFVHTEEWVTVHLLHDHSLSEDNRRYLMQLVRNYGQQIIFHNLEREYGDRLQRMEQENKWMEGQIKPGQSWAIWFRLLAGEALADAKRLIYLDADTIVNMDIKELWEEEIGANGLAAVPDQVIQEGHCSFLVKKGLCEEKRYFNSGVLLLDMTVFAKEKNLLERGVAFLKKHELIDYPDQDILNYFYGADCRLLPDKYNTLVNWEMGKRRNELESRIYHYANKQYAFDYGNNYHRLFLDNFAATPWCNADFFCRLAHNIQQNARSKLLVYANLTAGRKRIVVGPDKEEEKYRKMLMLREGERYLTAAELHAQGMNLAAGEILIFFLPYESFMQVKKHLESCGAVEGMHFINGMILTAPDAQQDAKAFLDA
ncbi:glycosyltransferase family 8 protein [Selenomonas ruminantium]|uniref:Lipopolysaccharide biosynthesis protein, LPS:glycosyltransferase n=1 Tax=Selenomonas ruminantium TaxID=971 RepID=A0A1H3ZFW3_SELRU|nr:glycosyltransferase [Selenomonas ruminantium]SEA22590.1 Lipopolysaccharide biosynthesis protein, LPS:glycosyltransferase [Selenomonas ruminantium]